MAWKRVLGWVLVAVAIVTIVAFNIHQQQADNSKRNVYAVLPLTGGLASVGDEYKKVIDNEIKNTEYPFHIVYVDSESNPMKGLTALQAATISEEHPIVFSFMSSVGSAIAPYVN